MERYTNRLRGSDQRVIVWVRDRKTGAEYPLHVQTAEVSGRTATFKSPFLAGKEILRVITMDADGPTMADQKKNAEILAVLQAGVDSFQSPFSQYIWQHDPNFTWPEDFATPTSSPSHPTPVKASSPLNDSQLQAVQHMLMSDNEHRVTIVQGPPGTGKTSVIAAYVESAVAAGRSGIWLIAQSNVAVKNIAEKLDKVGFDAWRLLVSKDFKFDWHDHLYRKIGSKVVQSDRFKYAQRELDKCHVILCTLSMLSNDRIDLFTKHVPMDTLVVDEASQIKVSDYLNPFNNFSSLRKLCFIGDDKQCEFILSSLIT
ncbi:P-loop containing nucleoside triphosphate hydrolase protein [Abortiporus biennis]|nr:P-loop containing nucleoside triphosphate hydrolase protein [Abortiporus biennis]